jgi:CheY-like chemotaxis protein
VIRQCRVLVIEDDPSILQLMTVMLETEGHTVVTMDSGLGAVPAVRCLSPDVILLDLGLPYRSGASLLTDLKADPETADIPVVILTALPDTLTGDRRALAASILAKPSDPDTILEAIQSAYESIAPPADQITALRKGPWPARAGDAAEPRKSDN